MAEMLEAKLGPSVPESGGVKAASTKSVTSMETTAAEAAMETAEAAMAAPAATARQHNVGCKHSKCCSRQQTRL